MSNGRPTRYAKDWKDPEFLAQEAERQAREEITEEDFRFRVALAKDRIRAHMGKPWYRRLFPFTIKIEWD